ncbi:protein kinase [Candidatus Uabimicrobium sp. HlEnr_7]|uniref:serine/threonine protein kinase n=1 Tax=Candidatus Uabimicrobium helgolandensis TaxID=3095367 RepID=UPI003558AC90
MKSKSKKELGKKNIINLLPGQMFNQYQIHNIIGKGAMGVVYKAFDKRLQRYVALKVLQASFIGEKEHKQFLREVKAIANLNHDNVVRLFEAGVNPTYYFTMEYIEGETLSQIIANEELSQQAIARIISKVAMGLYHAHVKGIIHGDIKPDNIMITKNREPKIMDFGLAKDRHTLNASQSGIQGTPAYLAPEQLQQEKIDKRADIYALGVTIYRSLTNKLPFNEKNYVSLFYQIMNEEPIKPRTINKLISPDLEIICLKCIQKTADKRYANARFLARDLQNFLVGRPLWGKSSNLSAFYKRFSIWRLETLALLFSIYFLFIIFQGSKKPLYQETNTVLLPWYNKKQTLSLQKINMLSQRAKLQNRKAWPEEIRNFMATSQDVDFNQKSINHNWINQLYDVAKQILQRAKRQNFSQENCEIAYSFLEMIAEVEHGSFVQKPEINFEKICDAWLSKLDRSSNEYKRFQSAKEIYSLKTLEEIENEKKNGKKPSKTKQMIFKEHSEKATLAQHHFSVSFDIQSRWLKEKNLLHAIALKPNFHFYTQLANFYMEYYLYSEVIALSRAELKENPHSPFGHYNMACALISKEEYSAALPHLTFLENNFFNTHRERMFFQKVRLFIIKKNKKAAQESLNQALQWVKEHKNEKYYKNAKLRLEKECDIWQQMINSIGGKNFSALPLSNEEKALYFFEVNRVNEAYKLIKYAKTPFLKLAIYRKMLNPKKLEFAAHISIWKEACDLAFGILKKEQNHSAIIYRYAFDFLGTIIHKKAVPNTGLATLKELGQKLGDYYFVYFYMAKYYRSQNLYNGTIYNLAKAKELAPWFTKEIILEEKIALMRWYKGKNVKNAQFLAYEIIDDYKNSGTAHILLGSIYTNKNIQKAKYHFDQAKQHRLSLRDQLDFYYDRAILYEQQKMYDKAINYMKIYIQFQPFIYATDAINRCEQAKLESKEK